MANGLDAGILEFRGFNSAREDCNLRTAEHDPGKMFLFSLASKHGQQSKQPLTLRSIWEKDRDKYSDHDYDGIRCDKMQILTLALSLSVMF